MQNDLRATAEKLANGSYRVGVRQDETTDGKPAFLAQVIELENCVGHGATEAAAVEDVRNAIVDYIESLLVDGLPVPTPIEELPVSFSVGSAIPAIRGKVEGVRQPDIPETIRPYLVAHAGA